LIDQQFTASVIYIKVQHALAFDRWLAEGGVPLADLGEVHVSRYQHRSRRRHQRIFDAPLVVDFLDELEKVRDVMPRTRNLRLTAIHSLFRYIAFEAPAHAAQTQRVLAIPAKRFTRALIPFLSRQEVDALLTAPDRRTWSGRRDHALILLAVQTGLRLSELTGLRQQNLHLGTGAHVHVIGKGRKERCTPLSKNTRTVLTAWMKELPSSPDQPLFPNARGSHLSSHGVHYLLAKHVAAATRTCPSLKRKRVSPRVLRHTTAMDLLQQGVEQSVIALWLGPLRSTWMPTLS
jgi:site-specific recombinase XerD